METGPPTWPNTRMALDKKTEERIDQPVSKEAERETRLSPTEAVAQMRINVPVRGNRKLRRLLERVNDDTQLKGWWHASNVNAVVRMQINDHSWVHIQIVANVAQAPAPADEAPHRAFGRPRLRLRQ